MMKRLLAAVLAALCLSALPLAAYGSEAFRVTVVLPYYHVWVTDVPDADDRFTYRWTVETEGAPTPEGVTNSYWDWELQGNTEGTLSLPFVFDDPGVFSYRLAAYVPNPLEGYVYEPRTYLLTVLVKNAGDGTLEVEWFLLNQLSGNKVDRLDLDPSYTKGPDPTQAPTESPTESPSEEPTQAPTESPTESPSEEPTQAPTDSPTQGPTEGPTRQPTEKPTEDKGDDNRPNTGDQNRIRSMAVILSVSGLLLVYLIREELGDWKKKHPKR